MTDRVTTRAGIVTNDRTPFRQYNFPISGKGTDVIRVNIPYTSTKGDIEEVIQHLQIVANRWEDSIGANYAF